MTDQPKRGRQGGDGLLLRRLETAQKDCMDQGQAAAAILLQDARAAIVRLSQTTRDAAEGATPKADAIHEEGFIEGVNHTVEVFAKLLKPTDVWHHADGSEDHDTDLANTFLNILAAKGLYDAETAQFATPQPAPDAMREALKLIERTCHARAATIARDALRTAPVPPADGALSEQERHAVGHARYQVERATPADPDCCFDFELVNTLLQIIDRRSPSATGAAEPVADDVLIERLKYFSGWSSRNVPGVELSGASKLCWDAIDEITRLRATFPVRGDREIEEIADALESLSGDVHENSPTTANLLDHLIKKLRALPVQSGADEREALASFLEKRAAGFQARSGSIFSGAILAEELRETARTIRQPPQSSSDDAPQSGCGVGGVRK